MLWLLMQAIIRTFINIDTEVIYCIKMNISLFTLNIHHKYIKPFKCI